MGEAKRRKELGLTPREKNLDLNLPVLDKKELRKKIRSTLYKYPIIPLLFYGAAAIIFVVGLIYFLKFYKLI